MPTAASPRTPQDLRSLGLEQIAKLYFNLPPAVLVEKSLSRGEGLLADNGALVVETGQFTGRSPKDKFIVKDDITQNTINWGSVNQPMETANFDALLDRLVKHVRGKDLFVKDCYAGADPKHKLRVRVVTEYAWQNLFAHQLFLRPAADEPPNAEADFHILFVPSFKAERSVDKTNSSTAIIIDFSKRLVVIAGTEYAGEMKKSVFTILNFLLPDQNVFPMHCSANMDDNGKVALFFGLSGTGKTTLSADPQRHLIGDDEHGWSSSGVFNFEGGCYAKTIKLKRENEPQIFDAIKFGSVLENVVIEEYTRRLDFDSDAKTENTRVAYPIDYISNAKIPSIGGTPNHVVFLTADAFGVLPPIARLDPEAAIYYFLSGYTAKLAGTERGMSKEPSATFSACFGEPFMPRHPKVYAQMLGDKLKQSRAKCWLVNTGWIGGPYGVGERMRLDYTRAMVNAAVGGMLDNIDTERHPVFDVEMPRTVPNVPAVLLNPRSIWKDPEAYDRAAADLKARFEENYKRFS
jgi:phosphoenolpyruvate carboxykinase (ATP)